MSTKLKKSVVMLTIATVLLGLASANMKVAFSDGTGGEIDLYTQKEPYSGRGPNTASDAFGPGEEVQVYALATYNEYPIQSILVAFQVLGPTNPVENISYSRVAFTDQVGVATISFRISQLNESTFGEWTVNGNAKIGDVVFTDTVTFKVGWIVEIVSLETVDENYMERESFSRGSCVGIELIVQNIAMVEKTATLFVTIYDCLGTFVNATELDDFVVQPNGTFVYTYFFLHIPKSAPVGLATIYASACTTLLENNGVPYCPEVSKQFSITPAIYFLTVRTEPTDVMTIPGEGWYEEYNKVDLTASGSLTTGTGVQYTFRYWDIDGTSQGMGNKSITVLMDNNRTATAHYSQTYTLIITTTVGGTTNPVPGTYNYTANSTIQVTAIPGANYVFDHWELDGAVAGAANPYPVYMDRDHVLRAVFSKAPAGWFVPFWFFWILLPLLILIIILLIIWFYRRKRRKKAEEAFHSGWTAWYYCYDWRRKTPQDLRFRPDF
jgi:hypothetical protein